MRGRSGLRRTGIGSAVKHFRDKSSVGDVSFVDIEYAD
jgi:hypothetical protein